MGRDRLRIEFGTYALWLAEAVASLQVDDRVAGACRGTGNPALLARLAAALAIGPDALVLDVGCGIGGPGEWLRRSLGARVVGVDVMEDGIRGLRSLFPGAPALVATTRALPFPDGTFDAAWALGVIETIDDKPGALREMARVLKRGARLGLYDYFSIAERVQDAPVADRFERLDRLRAVMSEAGFDVVYVRDARDLPPPPGPWADSAAAAHAEVARRHRGDPRLGAVHGELDKIARLCSSSQIEPWEMVLARR